MFLIHGILWVPAIPPPVFADYHRWNPIDVGSNGISCNNCFEEGGDPYIRSIDICFVPMVRIDDFLAAICTVTVCHASDDRFQVCAFYNLAIFVNRERVFKIDFKSTL